MEWFTNIWAWIVAHKDGIVTFVTSSSFIGFVTTILMLIRQRKAIKANTATGKELNEALAENKEFIDTVKTLQADSEQNGNKLSDVTDMLDTVIKKVGAVVEVLDVVYNHSVKDEATRKNINAILTNAKYAESISRAAIRKENEELLQKLAEFKDAAEKNVEKVNKIVTAEEKPPTVLRG